jgi:hypothetical protein
MMGVGGSAMVTIAAKGRVSRDGTLDLRVTTGLPETDVQVLLVLEPLVSRKAAWSEGFFERTFGSLRDNPIACEPPPQFELRQELC